MSSEKHYAAIAAWGGAARALLTATGEEEIHRRGEELRICTLAVLASMPVPVLPDNQEGGEE